MRRAGRRFLFCAGITGVLLALACGGVTERKTKTKSTVGNAIAPVKSNAITHGITCEVVSITDGDTLTVLDHSKTRYTIRLFGIDAPEKTQAYGTQASKALADKVFRKLVRVVWYEHDKYGRIVGDVYLDDRWINREMIEEGWAWHYRQYSGSQELAAAEVRARSRRARIWSDPYVAPWDFRRDPSLVDRKKQQVAAETRPATKEVTVYRTRTGKKYHRAGCRYLSRSKIPISLSQAKARYGACSVCRPPR